MSKAPTIWGSWRYFLLPLGLYLFLSVLYLYAIPAGESPDEPGHLQCIEQVALYQRLPIREPKPEGEWWSRNSIVSGRMCYHMPLHYVLAGGILRSVAAASNTDLKFEFPPSNEHFGEEVAMFVHDEPSLWMIVEPPTILSLRILSLLLGLVTVGGSFALARRITSEEPWIATLAAVLAAGWPQLAYLSRAITNDALATALAVSILLVLTRVGQPRRYILLAALSSLAVMTKFSVAFSAGVVLIAWFFEMAAFRENRRTYVRAILIAAVIWLATVILLLTLPVLREHLAISGSTFGGIADGATTIAYWQDFLKLTLSSGWARLGWMNLPAPPAHAYLWWILFTVAAATGLFFQWRSSSGKEQKLLLIFCLLWMTAVVLSYLRININRLQPQFRFMLAAVPVMTSWAAVGTLSWTKQRISRQWLIVGGIAVFLAGYNVWFVLTIVQQAYVA